MRSQAVVEPEGRRVIVTTESEREPHNQSIRVQGVMEDHNRRMQEGRRQIQAATLQAVLQDLDSLRRELPSHVHLGEDSGDPPTDSVHLTAKRLGVRVPL